MAKTKRFQKIYLEITNCCNLRCSFCPGTQRPPHRMTEAELAALLPKLRPWTDYLYFHLMGEPLSHPQLARFLQMAYDAGFRVILTTNGTLLPQCQATLLSAPGLHKVNISLHAFEANELHMSFHDYLQGCLSFGQAAAGRKLISYRLWNSGGQDLRNAEIQQALRLAFPSPWVQEPRGIRIAPRVYLEHGERFDWPDWGAEERDARLFCYALRDQLGILCDGTVVPCCLDHEGALALGNLFQQELSEILESPRARAIYDGFSSRQAREPFCRRCGYARRFD